MGRLTIAQLRAIVEGEAVWPVGTLRQLAAELLQYRALGTVEEVAAPKNQCAGCVIWPTEKRNQAWSVLETERDTLRAMQQGQNERLAEVTAERDEAIAALSRRADGWVPVSTPPEHDKPYLVTDGKNIVSARYMAVPYPLGNYMEWCAIDCIPLGDALKNGTHYREFALPQPPKEAT